MINRINLMIPIATIKEQWITIFAPLWTKIEEGREKYVQGGAKRN